MHIKKILWVLIVILFWWGIVGNRMCGRIHYYYTTESLNCLPELIMGIGWVGGMLIFSICVIMSL